MNVSLRKLLQGISGLQICGSKDPLVQSLAIDSRRVMPGALFFAVPGRRTDGALYIAEAIERGAVAVVSEKDCWVPAKVCLVRTADMRALMAQVAARFFGQPQEGLELTGFMGTSGKTVASTLCRHFLAEHDPVGLLGTIQYAVGNRTLPAHRTTPEPIELHALLAQIRHAGCRHTLMEVSAHGIDQGRVAGLRFKRLALLNLTPEHLDYHGSFANYLRKETDFLRSQFSWLEQLVLGIDDPQCKKLHDSLTEQERAKLVTFGLSAAAQIRAESIRYTSSDTRFTLITPGGALQCVSPLIGEFNLQNLLAAIACGIGEGISVERMVARLLSFESVRGRMERIEASRKPAIIVDYMHTVAAYERGLRQVRDLTRGRLIVVFGCGGGRDPGPRPLITSLVCDHADVAIATADNPRHESMDTIFGHMRTGNEGRLNLHFIADRRGAIAEAVQQAKPEDLILIAGKGHETYQEFADCVVPFDDRATARELLHNHHWYSS